LKALTTPLQGLVLGCSGTIRLTFVLQKEGFYTWKCHKRNRYGVTEGSEDRVNREKKNDPDKADNLMDMPFRQLLDAWNRGGLGSEKK
jgi:hypothetical protein